jgi:hypothetical protein
MSFGSSPSQQVKRKEMKRKEKKRWEYKATKLPMPFYGEWVTMEHGPKKLKPYKTDDNQFLNNSIHRIFISLY